MNASDASSRSFMIRSFSTARCKKIKRAKAESPNFGTSKLAGWCVASCSIHNREKLPRLFPWAWSCFSEEFLRELHDRIVIYHVPAVIYKLFLGRWSTITLYFIAHIFLSATNSAWVYWIVVIFKVLRKKLYIKISGFNLLFISFLSVWYFFQYPIVITI